MNLQYTEKFHHGFPKFETPSPSNQKTVFSSPSSSSSSFSSVLSSSSSASLPTQSAIQLGDKSKKSKLNLKSINNELKLTLHRKKHLSHLKANACIQSLSRPSTSYLTSGMTTIGAFKPILKKSLTITKSIKQKMPSKRSVVTVM